MELNLNMPVLKSRLDQILSAKFILEFAYTVELYVQLSVLSIDELVKGMV